METSNYHFGQQVGKGGMAVVYEGSHKSLGHKVAIKVLNPEFRIQENIRKRFIEEARRLARMNHANLVKVTDSIEEGDMVAFVMEFIEGKNLRDYLHSKGRLGDAEIEFFLGQMVDALGFVHQNGLVHRDIKPSNFMVTDAGQIKLLDFGIAKSLDQAPADYAQTGTGVQMGTPIYMSPEQVHGARNLNEKSDQYSLGVVLWEMVSGRKPYDTETLSGFQIQSKIVNDSLPTTGTRWDEVIQKATSKDPQMRFAALSEMLSKNPSVIHTPPADPEKTIVGGGAGAAEEKTQVTTENSKVPDLRDNRERANQVQIIFWALFGLTLIGLISSFFEYNLIKEIKSGSLENTHLADASKTRQQIIGIMQLGLNLVCIVYFLRWFRRAYRNAHQVAGKQKLKFPESEGLWAWLIPFVNFYKPYQVAKEMWLTFKSSLGIPQNAEKTFAFSLWWTFYLIQAILGREAIKRSFKTTENDDYLLTSGINILSDGVDLIAIVLTIMMIQKVSEMEFRVFRKYSGKQDAESGNNRILWFILGGFLIASLGSFIYIRSMAETAEQVKLGTDAYNRSDYTTAYSIFSKEDVCEDKVAQYHLGMMHLYGQGVSEDKELAKKWFEKSAEQEDADAQTMLGYMYENGLTNSGNAEVEAFNWYKKSAEQGNSVGQNNLGMCYMEGRGTNVDTVEALRYVQLSADQNFTLALNNLAWMYANGRCVEKNLTESFNNYMKSAQLGDADGQRELARCYWEGTGVGNNFTEAENWLRKSVDQGNPDAHWFLGIMLWNGLSGNANQTEALNLLNKGVRLGSNGAADFLREIGYSAPVDSTTSEPALH